MALFLTGMINDGAHTGNGPGETRFYQTEKEGRKGQGGRKKERERRVCGEGGVRFKPSSWHYIALYECL